MALIFLSFQNLPPLFYNLYLMPKNKYRSRSRSWHKHKTHHHSKYSSSRYRKKNRHRKYSSSFESRSISDSSSYSSSYSSSSSKSSYSDSGSSSDSISESAKRRHQTTHFRFKKGQKLDHKYKIKRLLGDGTFGRVVECEYKQKLFAIKVIKPVQKYINSARTEKQIIREINRKDKQDKQGIVRYVQSFYHHHHYCLVFKPLGQSLYDLIKMNKYKGFPIKLVREFFKQMLQSLKFLHRNGFTHTDLKPQNILLEDERLRRYEPSETGFSHEYFLPLNDKIRIIDFGGATYYDDYHSSIINTRQYRSPEVILQCCSWNQISDVWSIGCIICELYTGDLLFQTHEDVEHLAMIEKNSGRFPHWMINKAKNSYLRKTFYDGYINEQRVAHIQNIIGLRTVEETFRHQPQLVDLLKKCLQISPNNRINCKDALGHQFFGMELQ